MKKLFYTPIIAVLMILTACASLGLPTANSFNERLAVGYTTVTAIRQSATVLLTSKQMSAEDGANVLEQTNNARTGLDVARSMSKTDMTAADAKLNAIRSALVALQAYLATKETK